MLLYKDIVKVGDPVLREKSLECSIPLTKDDFKALVDMNEYLINGYNEKFCEENEIRPGVGIAAPQIGLSKKMLCILAYDEKGDLYNFCMINPKIISHSEESTYLESGEGCLSVVDEHKGYIHRHKRVKISTYLYNFETNTLSKETIQLKGYLAIVFQHEFDHLNGILFFDRINKDDPFYIPDNSSPVIFNKD